MIEKFTQEELATILMELGLAMSKPFYKTSLIPERNRVKAVFPAYHNDDPKQGLKDYPALGPDETKWGALPSPEMTRVGTFSSSQIVTEVMQDLFTCVDHITGNYTRAKSNNPNCDIQYRRHPAINPEVFDDYRRILNRLIDVVAEERAAFEAKKGANK